MEYTQRVVWVSWIEATLGTPECFNTLRRVWVSWIEVKTHTRVSTGQLSLSLGLVDTAEQGDMGLTGRWASRMGTREGHGHKSIRGEWASIC
jgi:hypothetical protein